MARRFVNIIDSIPHLEHSRCNNVYLVQRKPFSFTPLHLPSF
jgi:hypothetical protein